MQKTLLICSIEHRIAYRYSRPVFLAPHRFRVRPRETPFQKIRAFSFLSDPLPAGLSHSLETEGHIAMQGWFDGVTHKLETVARIEMELWEQNPFEFLPADGSKELPIRYERQERSLLVPFMQKEADAEVRRFADACVEQAGGKTLPFLMGLCMAIHRRCPTIVRPEGEAWSAAKTLVARCGACRDLALLFIGCCRSAGLAARFVSGYHLAPPAEGPRHLHAWGEVYIPGGGWRGFDPSTGLAVAGEHIPLAASATPQGAALVEGSFFGNGVVASMENRIEIRSRRECRAGD